MEGLLDLHKAPLNFHSAVPFSFGALKMIDLLCLNRLVGSLQKPRDFQRMGRRGVIRKLTLWQGGYHALGESSEQGTEPPVSSEGGFIQFSAPLRFSNDTRFTKAPVTRWRIEIETRTLIRLVPYINQYAKHEHSENGMSGVLGDLTAKYTDRFLFSLDLKMRVEDMDNQQLQLLLRELFAHTVAISGLLQEFEQMSGSNIQRLPSQFLKLMGDEIVNFFDRLCWKYNL